MKLANRTIFFLILALVVASTLAYGTVHQPTLAIFYAVIGFLVVLWAIDCFAGGEIKVSRHIFQLPLVLAAVYCVIQIIPFGSTDTALLDGIPRTISFSPFDTQLTAIHFVSIAIFLSLALIYIDSAQRLDRVVKTIVIFGFAFAFFAILQSFLSPTRIYGLYERPSPFGSFVNRHNFAAFMEMTIAVPLGLLFAGAVRRDRKLLYVTAVTLMGVALLLSGSRGGLVAMLAEVVFLVFITTRSRGAKNIALKISLAVLLVAAVVGGAILVGGDSSLARIAETAKAGDITTNRTEIWRTTLGLVRADLPLGAGFGAFGEAYTPFDPRNGLERVEQAHDDYLQVVADAGVVGAVIGLFFLISLYRAGRQNIATSNIFRRGVAIGSLAGIFAVLVHSVFDFVLHTTAISLLFVLLLAMLAASGRKFDDDIREFDVEPRRRSRGSVESIRSARTAR